ncbi:MAG: serine protease AprX [Solirubrobacteraceae bacterium]|nr:serine protease AprX [Solirubrobacteraceae bacterium]
MTEGYFEASAGGTGEVTGTRWRIVSAAALAFVVAMLASSSPALAGSADAFRPSTVTDVVVLEAPGAGSAPEGATRRVGGRVLRELPIVRGFSARIPLGGLGQLRRVPSVRSVHPDRPFALSAADAVPGDSGVGLEQVRAAIGADSNPDAGAGVDIALVDSGITPVGPLAEAGKVVDGPDFSADANDPRLRNLDAFGHGTHLAGIIAGSAGAAGPGGIAPGGRLVNVKVAAHDGSTSLSSLLSGIDWVVRNRHRDGLDIRVLNLSFGADSDGSYRSDPLAAAVEQAWQRGIVVVTAAGNGGARAGGLDSPAYDPFVLAVGAEDMMGSADVSDDVAADFSSAGSADRMPDVVAPGVGIVSVRVPGGVLDEAFPQARIGSGGFRGSGTSQSAAVVSGAAARLLQARPELDPDEVKGLLRSTARSIGAEATIEGRGLIDIGAATGAATPRSDQRFPRASGGAWRGRAALGVEFAVERSSATRWSATRWSATRWSGSEWGAEPTP